MPSDHYLSLGMLGMHGTVYSNYAINEADLLLAFGVRFDDRVTGKLSEFAKHGRIVHVDIDASEINKNKAATSPSIPTSSRSWRPSNPLVETGDLTRLAPPDRRLARRGPDDLRPARRRDPAPVRHRPVLRADRRRLPHVHRRRPAPDVGGAVDEVPRRPRPGSPPAAWARWASACPRRWALQAAFPDKLVVDIDGDGSFLMNIQELATCLLREPAGEGHRAEQPAPRHGRPVGRPLPRRQPRPHLPRPRRPPRGLRQGHRRLYPT